ncbi:MAG TPA: hypothetical protein VF838_00975 [Trebonia sp.]
MARLHHPTSVGLWVLAAALYLFTMFGVTLGNHRYWTHRGFEARLYGIACVGKSITALQYAIGNGIRSVISTDYLREVQRLYVPSDESPALAKVSDTAWELTGDSTPGGIVAGFTSHAEAVFPSVAAVAVKLAGDGPRRGSCSEGLTALAAVDGPPDPVATPGAGVAAAG